MANEKLITLRGLTKFKSNLVLGDKSQEIYDFLPSPYRWINGVLEYEYPTPSGGPQACINRMIKLKKDTVVITSDLDDYYMSIHCYDSSQNLLYNTTWITLENNSILGYKYFKSLDEDTEYFTIMAKRKDGSPIDFDDFKSNISIYNNEHKKNKLVCNMYAGATLTDGVPETNAQRIVTEPIIFDESLIINIDLIQGIYGLRLNFNCFDENGQYLGKTGYFGGYNRSITGYDIKEIANINKDIKFIHMLVRTSNNNDELDYDDIKNNVNVYISKEKQIELKQQKYCPYNLLSPLKNNTFVYSIGQGGKNVTGYRSQGMACYNGTAFISYYNSTYSENSKILVCDKKHIVPALNNTFIDLGSAIHIPAMNFGEKQNESDLFPLLYVTVGETTLDKDPTCLVYKITLDNNTYSATLVKTISIGFTNDDLWGISNEQVKYAVDIKNNLLVLFKSIGTTSNRIFVFELPTSDKTLQTTDILYYFDVPYADLSQDICIKNNLLYVISGRPEATLKDQYNRMLRVIDIFDKKELGRLNFKQVKNNYTYAIVTFEEPEGIDFLYDNRLIISQGDYAKLFVIDIREPNIDNDFGE